MVQGTSREDAERVYEITKMKTRDVIITETCIELDKLMVELKDCISHGKWKRADIVLGRIEWIAKGGE